MENEKAIELKQVTYSVDNVDIIKGVTGSFAKGSITTIVGPSGAGKSTLFRLCNGMKSANSGEIYIEGKSIFTFDPVILRKKIGIVLQKATMVSGTVRDNLALPLKLAGKELKEKEATELIQLVGLDQNILARNSNDLSGGQKQKVSIARTLINRPEVLLLDEITSSLDRVSQQEVEKLIQKINSVYGTTIIWITHNLEQATRIGNDTWVMMDGELVEMGPSDLLHKPKNDRVKRFVKGDIQ
ncbi:ABC transporter ATP-binding protein [Shouchella patagoniensis]|uniref:ABC transporter ATP-binding protein n=1 Tax=Shouchella patagoniensis TaxID=228576 RepID=UPI000994ABB8|nr:phosphate ABC transporter ATP-binding protein [Shouchella patagoniensis]